MYPSVHMYMFILLWRSSHLLPCGWGVLSDSFGGLNSESNSSTLIFINNFEGCMISSICILFSFLLDENLLCLIEWYYKWIFHSRARSYQNLYIAVVYCTTTVQRGGSQVTWWRRDTSYSFAVYAQQRSRCGNRVMLILLPDLALLSDMCRAV